MKKVGLVLRAGDGGGGGALNSIVLETSQSETSFGTYHLQNFSQFLAKKFFF